MQYILSTMTSSVSYNFYQTVGDLPVVTHKILIQGGASIPSLRSGYGDQSTNAEGQPIWTADGVLTVISDDDWAKLKDNIVFKKHEAKSLVKHISKDIRGNYREVKKHSADMEADGFRQLNKDTISKTLKVTTQFMPPEGGLRI